MLPHGYAKCMFQHCTQQSWSGSIGGHGAPDLHCFIYGTDGTDVARACGSRGMI